MTWTDRLVEVNRVDSKVVIAYLHPGEVSQSFHGSIMDSFAYDRGRFVDNDGRLAVLSSMCGANGIVRSRNQTAASFLDGHPHADLLMFVDADMGWDPDAIETMAQIMDRTGLPVLGGLCFGSKAIPVLPGQQRGHETTVFPTIYSWNTHGRNAFDTRYDYPPDQIIEVGATGGAFLMIHRTALEAIRTAEGDEWFTPVVIPGEKPFGEDLSFCMRARSHGIPIHVHTGIKTSHKKETWITEATYRDLRTPASSAVTVVIPVKDNLEMTRDLCGQLVNQGGITDVLLFDNGSSDPEMVEWLQAQTEVSVFDAAEAPGISHMWNAGIDEAIARHRGLADVVFLNNDIALGPRCIRRLVAGLRSQPGLMAACPNYDQRPGSGVSPLRSICANRYGPDADGVYHGGLAGFAFALRSEWLATGFRFDENMAWWYSDNDLCLEIEKAGGWYGMVHDSHCQHLGGGSQTATPEGWAERVEADRLAFEAKWPHATINAA